MSTDRTTIRDWATHHDAVPVRESGTGDERYRIVHRSDVGSTHTEAEWDDFFTHLDENDHVVIYREEGAGEPFDVAHREDAVSRSSLERTETEERLLEGETVTLSGDQSDAGVTEFEFDDDQIGKTVVDATGDEVGMVTDVDPEARLLHVDVDPGITEKIKAALDWGDVSDDDYPVSADQIQSVSDDEIRLREREDLVSGTREE